MTLTAQVHVEDVDIAVRCCQQGSQLTWRHLRDASQRFLRTHARRNRLTVEDAKEEIVELLLVYIKFNYDFCCNCILMLVDGNDGVSGDDDDASRY
jgi:hypothetical protein